MANREFPVENANAMYINLIAASSATPTVKMSGTLFLSGGLWFKAHTDAYTQLAAE